MIIEEGGTIPEVIPPEGVLIRRVTFDYITGTGDRLRSVHSPFDCVGRPCVIHEPSNHHMLAWPTNWRDGGALDIKPPHMERVCQHGVGHPDPDDMSYWASKGEDIGGHGCDGCCGLEVAV